MPRVFWPQGLVTIFFIPRLLLNTGGNLKCQIVIQHFFKIVLYWCLDMIRHNIDTPLKHNKYIFDIPILFCHHLYLSATLKQSFIEFTVVENVFHAVYMSVPGRIPMFHLIGRLFLWSGLHKNNRPIKWWQKSI